MVTHDYTLLCKRAPVFCPPITMFPSIFETLCLQHIEYVSPWHLFHVIEQVSRPQGTLISCHHINIREFTSIALCLESPYLLDHICNNMLTPITTPHILLILFNTQKPDSKHLNFIFHYLEHNLGIPKELAINKLYTKHGTYSSRPLQKLIKSRMNNPHLSKYLCSICWPAL